MFKNKNTIKYIYLKYDSCLYWRFNGMFKDKT